MWCQIKLEPRYQANIAEKYPKVLKFEKQDDMALPAIEIQILYSLPLSSIYKGSKVSDPVGIVFSNLPRPYFPLSQLERYYKLELF